MLIHIHQLKVVCIVGCLPEERVQAQELFFDISYSVDAPKHDHIEAAVDYTKVAELVEKRAVEGKFQLLEHVAKSISEAILEQFLAIHSVCIKVIKPKALAAAHSSSVEYKKDRK